MFEREPEAGRVCFSPAVAGFHVHGSGAHCIWFPTRDGDVPAATGAAFELRDFYSSASCPQAQVVLSFLLCITSLVRMTLTQPSALYGLNEVLVE